MGSWVTNLALLSGGVGLGLILSSIITNRYAQKKLLFETKLTKYSNLIESYRDLESESKGEDINSRKLHFVSCLKQVELIGSDKIRAISQEYKVDQFHIQNDIRDKLVAAMREDLKKHRWWRLCS